LIDRKGQLLATAKVAGVVSALLVLLNMVFSLWSAIETQAIAATNPELLDEMTAIDRRTTMTLIVISIVILLVVIVRAIMLTHRTAGAAFNLTRCLNNVAAGEYGTELRVRRKDNLKNLQEPFNRMMESLRDRAADDQAALMTLADKIDELGEFELAAEVRALAKAKEAFSHPEPQ
jgi:nitrogen fixation/metabolism regulation signal transduction histidine kinase